MILVPVLMYIQDNAPHYPVMPWGSLCVDTRAIKAYSVVSVISISCEFSPPNSMAMCVMLVVVVVVAALFVRRSSLGGRINCDRDIDHYIYLLVHFAAYCRVSDVNSRFFRFSSASNGSRSRR